MVLVRGEISEPPLEVVVRHAVADALFGLWSGDLDHAPQLPKERLRRFGRSRDVGVDLVAHLPALSSWSSPARRSIDSSAPLFMPDATMPSRSITD